MDCVNTAYERMFKSDVKYRFVIDMAGFREARFKDTHPPRQNCQERT
ncbi:MAG TPA: hypothetical protein VLS47_03625 [Gallionella sp.]|nr:hypothetical protein [Gallionella sp.]